MIIFDGMAKDCDSILCHAHELIPVPRLECNEYKDSSSLTCLVEYHVIVGSIVSSNLWC